MSDVPVKDGYVVDHQVWSLYHGFDGTYNTKEDIDSAMEVLTRAGLFDVAFE